MKHGRLSLVLASAVILKVWLQVAHCEILSTEQWSIAINSDIFAVPCVDEQTIYTGTRAGELIAIDLDGHVKWKRLMDFSEFTSATIDDDGTVYVPTRKGFCSVERDGAMRLFQLGSQSSPVSIGKDVLYATSVGSLFALSRNGALLWKVKLTEGWITPAIVGGGRVYSVAGGTLCAVNLDGAVLWRYQAEGWPLGTQPVLGSGRIIYFASGSAIYAIREDGTLKWRYQAERTIFSSPVVSSTGAIFFGDLGGNFYALSAGGDKLWQYKTPNIINSTATINSQGRVYVGSGDQCYAFSKDGRLLWTQKTGKLTDTAFVLSDAGKLYISNFYGVLHSIDVASGPDHNAWPVWRHNPRGTASIGAE